MPRYEVILANYDSDLLCGAVVTADEAYRQRLADAVQAERAQQLIFRAAAQQLSQSAGPWLFGWRMRWTRQLCRGYYCRIFGPPVLFELIEQKRDDEHTQLCIAGRVLCRALWRFVRSRYRPTAAGDDKKIREASDALTRLTSQIRAVAAVSETG